jgi:hypothetical protein
VQELEAMRQAVEMERTVRESMLAEMAQLQSQQQVGVPLLSFSLGPVLIVCWLAVGACG